MTICWRRLHRRRSRAKGLTWAKKYFPLWHRPARGPGGAGRRGDGAGPGYGATVIRVGYVRWVEPRATISLIDKPAPNDGLAGAKLGIADNDTTGHFLGQSYELLDVPVRAGDDLASAVASLARSDVALVMTDAPAAQVLQLAAAAGERGATLFNVAAPDDALREESCRDNVIHVAPTRSMLADALAQYLVWKKWSRWVLATGSHPEDGLLADAYRRAAKRFGARIVKEIVFEDTGGSRQTDSGVVQIQQQMPVFTQHLPDYDVLVAADENEVFAGYLPYRTWDARPVAGSAGLRPVTWDAGQRFLGWHAGAGPVRADVPPAHDRARHAGLGGGADDRRGREPRRAPMPPRWWRHQGAGLRRRCLQGPTADAA